jgi:hypothetical protein
MTQLTARNTRTAGLVMIGALALTACDRPAGWELDTTGGFGNATVNNLVAQTCTNIGASGSGKYGGKAGATLGDPVVVLDPQSTPANPVYRVYCDGRLDGKYAEIIYRDYVASATQKTTVAQAAADEE